MDMNTTRHPSNWKVIVLTLKEIATDQGISQQEIAEKTGLLQSNVSRIFALKYCPRLDLLLAIADAVGVTIFIESKNSKTDLNQLFEQAMTQLGRRPDNLPKN